MKYSVIDKMWVKSEHTHTYIYISILIIALLKDAYT